MSANTDSVNLFGAALENLLHLSLREFAFGVHENIVKDTPVDTGRARSSWNLSEDEPDTSATPLLVDYVDEVSKETVTHGASGSSPLNADQATVAAMASQQNVGDHAEVVYVTNAVEYIEQLENGHSKQAPQGMVAINTSPGQLQAQFDAVLAKRKF